MSKNIKRSLLLIGLIGLLASCDSLENITTSFNGTHFLLMPTGAPTLALFDSVANNNEVETTSTTTEVRDMFLSDNYKYLVFDATQASSLITNNDSNYTFVKLLTAGNFHLIGINKDTNAVPTEDDYIIGYGAETSVPVQTYNLLFPDAPIDNLFTSGVGDLTTYLAGLDYQGKVGDQQIDWIIIAQPSLYILSMVEGMPLSTLATVDYNVNDLFYAEYGVNIPQAALFVHEDYYLTYTDEVNSFLDYVDLQLYLALNDADFVYDTITSYSDTVVMQTARFGYYADIAKALQADGANQFGIVDPDLEYTSEDLQVFLNILTGTATPVEDEDEVEDEIDESDESQENEEEEIEE